MDNQIRTFSDKFKRRVKFAIVIMAGIALIGIAMHIINYIKLWYGTAQNSVLAVAVTTAKSESPIERIILPGSVQAWHETTIFARSNGYVVNWLVDIGAHVKAGELLAEISAPEVVAQLQATEANLVTAEARYQLAKSTADRWQFLLKTDSVSKQETDEKVSNAAAEEAVVASTRAERDRLRDLVNYQRIVAPFDGIIMSRTTDIGRLINAGSGTVPLFRIVQEDRLRVYVRVPEFFSKSIKNGLTAELVFNEHPGKKYPAKLLDTAKAIDNKSRTLLVQLEIDNKDGELLAGSYAQVHFALPISKNDIVLPINAVIFNAKGIQVAVINDNKVMFKSVTIGRDFGSTIEIVAGLNLGDKVVLNPPDSLLSGQKVNVVSTDGNKEQKTA